MRSGSWASPPKSAQINWGTRSRNMKESNNKKLSTVEWENDVMCECHYRNPAWGECVLVGGGDEWLTCI